MDWTETTVGEFCPFVYGKGLPKTKRVKGQIPVYGSNGCVDFHSESYIKGSGIIIGRKGSVGAVHLSEVPFWPIDTSFYIEKETLDELKFTYYLLKSLGLEDMNSDSAVPGLNRDNAHALPIKIPDSKEDRERLGRWIAIYDEKIELNRQTNQTLEHIAQAIFKSWFVDFEPTRAKIAAKQKGGNPLAQELAAQAVICGAITLEGLQQIEPDYLGIEHRLHPIVVESFEPMGLDFWQPEQLRTIAALFPDALTDSELGEIPEGWEVVGFKDIVKKYIDNRGKTPPITESGIPLLEIKHLPEYSIKPDLNTSKHVDEETFESWFRAHLEAEDIMISTVGTIGRICMVPEGEKIAIAQNLLGMRFKRDEVSPYFMYYQMDGFRFRHDVDARLVITVQASIKRKDLETIDLLSPTKGLQDYFEDFVKPFVVLQQNNQDIKLAEVRDLVLPKLLSGELKTNIKAAK